MYPRLAQFGSLVIPTYSVVAAIGLVAALLLAEWCAPRAGVPRDRVWSLSLWSVGATVVLSRMALVLETWPAARVYPRLVLTLPTLTKWGPAIAALSLVGCMAALRLPWLRTLDAVSPAVLLLLTALHLGSFFAGDELGRATTLPLGNLVRGDEGHHPVALYAAALFLLACGASMWALLRDRRAGRTFAIAVAGGAVAQFVADEFRPAYLLPRSGVSGFLRTDQWVLLLLTLTGLLSLMRLRRAE